MAHRTKWMRALAVGASLALAATAGCGNGDEAGDAGDARDPGVTTTVDGATTTTRDATTSTDRGGGEALAQSCTNPQDNYRIRYPDGWHTNDGDVVPTCELFDTRPVQVEENTEADEPILLDVEPVAFERASEPSRGERVIERRTETIDGRDAVRLETEATEDAPLREPGDRQLRWVVRVTADRTFIATARAVDTVSYADATAALDAMVATLELTDD